MPRKRPNLYDPIDGLVTDEDVAEARSGDIRRLIAAIDRVIARIKRDNAALRGERRALVANARQFYPPGHPQRTTWQAELDELAA